MSFALFSLFLSLSGGHLGRSQPAAQELAPFVGQLQALLTKRDVPGIEALAQEPRSVAWLRHRTDLSGPWQAHALRVPGRRAEDATAVIVFSAFHTCQSIGDHAHRVVREGEVWRLGPEIPEADTLGLRVRDHRLNVRYDFPRHGVTVDDAVTFERTVPEAGPGLLRLSSDMVVDRVARGGEPFAVEMVPGVLAFVAPDEKTFTLSLSYHGTVNHPGTDYVNERESVLCSYWYPHVGRLPATHTVTATVPRGWLSVGQGNLLHREDGPESSTFTYRNDVPTCYFTLDAGAYKVTERTVDGRRLSCYELKPLPGRAERLLDQLAPAIRFYDASFGKFPYDHYGLVETVGQFPALEAYSFATFQTVMFGVLTHELAHTWWGGVVPNPYTRTLWNESFAVYSETLLARAQGSAPDRPTFLGLHSGSDRGRDLLAGYSVPLTDAFDTENSAESNVGYEKGGRVLGMLEQELGRPTMLRCLRAFYENHPRGEAGDWEEFAAAVRKTTGTDYGWFFDQWLTRTGGPVLRLASAETKREGGMNVVTAQIVQQGQPYRLRVPVLLEAQDGTSTRTLAEVSEATSTVKLSLKSPPKRLVVDPDGAVLMAGADVPDGGDPFVFTFSASKPTTHQ